MRALKMQNNPPVIGKRAIVISENNHRHLQIHGYTSTQQMLLDPEFEEYQFKEGGINLSRNQQQPMNR